MLGLVWVWDQDYSPTYNEKPVTSYHCPSCVGRRCMCNIPCVKGRGHTVCVPWVDKGQDDPWGAVAGLWREGRMKEEVGGDGGERGEGGG